MANDPAFLFYPGDYLRDTQCLSEESQVSYDRIMCEHMRNIRITQQQFDFFTKRLNSNQKSELKVILKFENGQYFIPWVVDSIVKRREYSESRRKNRSTTNKESKKISKSYVHHMENEIENVNAIESTLKTKSEILKNLFDDEQYIEDLQSAHREKDLKAAFEECYMHHSNSPSPPQELWEWRQKLNTWLTIKGDKKNGKKFETNRFDLKDV